MREKRYPVSLLLLLLCGMMVLTSCSAITAQRITLNTGGMGGGNNRNALRGMMNADLIGKIVAVNGSKMTIDVMEQAQRRSPAVDDHSAVLSSPSQTTTPNSNITPDTHTPNTDRTLPTDRSNGSTSTMSKTGVEKTITIGEEVSISQITAMMPQSNKNSTATTLKVSDLKAGQILMIWYKDNTNTVEKISVMDS
ncbi:hypothetical protein [Paenibacillus nuruki]|uniref:hypothetical protein n=1 Tax=Paenibacillus nuruki TaxID=1886670 RepID=UPI0028047F92|nr:hypothetical protein [Paenibacillus nuruki]CAJ1316615.1 DUF1344 domain-containing protein [Paenibacillus nuruki]